MTESITYTEEKIIKKIYSSNEILEFVFDVKEPEFVLPFMGLDISILFINEMYIPGISAIKHTKNDITITYKPSFTDYVLPGLTGNNGDIISYSYDNSILTKIVESRSNNTTEHFINRNDKNQIFEINTFFNGNFISQKEFYYSNDIMYSFIELNKTYNLIFDDLNIQQFNTKSGNYNIEYLD